MANTIITKNSSTTTNVPTAGEMVEGELAVNTTDKRLWTKTASAVVELTDHDILTNYVAAQHVDWAAASAGTIHTDNYIENYNHTGQVTGDTALSLAVAAITDQPASGAIVATDTILTNDGGVLSETTFTQLDTYFSSSLGVVADGTGTNNTLRWSGSAWVESANLLSTSGGAVSSAGDLRSNTDVYAGTATSPQCRMDASSGFSFATTDSIGGWARGVLATDTDFAATLAGAGWLGSDEAVSAYHIGFGTDWWSTHSVFTINSSGDVAADGDVTGANLNVSDWDTAFGWGDHGHPHTTFDRASAVLSGANVFSNIVVTDGITTAIATRAMSINDLGGPYTNNAGTVTSVGTNTGLSGTVTGSGNLSLDLPSVALGGTLVAGDWLLASNGGVQNRQLISAIPLSIFNDDLSYLSSVAVSDLDNGTDGELITWSAAGVATTVPVGTSGHVLTSGGTGVAPTFQAAAGGGVDTLPGQFRGVSNQNISTTTLTVDFQTEVYDPDSNYSVTSDVITISEAGYYWVSYGVFTRVASGGGNTRATVTTKCTLNGTTTDIIGSYASGYMNETNNPVNGPTCSTSFIYLFDADDTIRIRAWLNQNLDLDTDADKCNISFIKIRDA